MANREEKIVYFAETDFRNKQTRFGIKAHDRLRHVYVIGKTGMGKSTLLENMAIQDIRNGEGMAFLDPHGAVAEKLLEFVPEERIKDVVYFSPFDLNHPISFNVLEDVGKDQRHLVVSGLMSTFKKIWVDAWSARMEYILTNTLLALLEAPGSTLLGVNRMYTDRDYRDKVISTVADPGVRSFWVDEYAQYTERFAAEATPAIQNKVGQFTQNPLIRNIIGQPRSSFDFRKVMDEKKIIIVNLSKGRVGEDNASLLGSMIITKLYLAAMSRAAVGAAVLERLPPFYLYVDEFQSFANKSFADILSESRKYKLSLTIAHQYVDQMEEEVRDAVFGNVGTTVAFRVGPLDAELLEKIFAPKFTIEDVVNLGFAQIYLTLMIEGVGSPPFSAVTLPPFPKPPVSYAGEIMENSRRTYSRPRQIVEDEIKKWHAPVFASAPSQASSRSSGEPRKKRRSQSSPPAGAAPAGGQESTLPVQPLPPASPPRQPLAPPKISPPPIGPSKSLKDLISAALSSKKPEQPSSSPIPPKPLTQPPPVQPPKNPPLQKQTHELPESELRKILDTSRENQ